MQAGNVVEIRKPARGFEAGKRGVIRAVDEALGTVTVAFGTPGLPPVLVLFSPETLGLVARGDVGAINDGDLPFPENHRSTRPSDGSGRRRFSNESRAIILG